MKNPLLVSVDLGDSRITAHLVKRASTYHAVFHIRGERHSHSTKFPDIARARIRAAELVETAAVAGAIKPLDLQAAIDKYLLVRWPHYVNAPAPKDRCTPVCSVMEPRSTFVDHRGRLNKFAKEVGPGTCLATMDEERAARFFKQYLTDRRSAGDAPYTLISFRAIFSRFCRELLDLSAPDGSKLVPWKFNPCAGGRLGKIRAIKRDPPQLTDTEAVEILEHCEGKRCFPAVLLALGAGLRPVELIRVRWGELNFVGSRLRAFAKSKWREPFMPQWVSDELTRLKNERNAQPQERICPCNKRTLNRSLDAVRKKHNMPAHVTLQAMRATYSERLKELTDFRTYSRQMGHSANVGENHYWRQGLIGEKPPVDQIEYKRPEPQEPPQNLFAS